MTDIEKIDESLVQLHPAWRQALQSFLDADYEADAIVPHAWFYEALGLEMPADDAPYGEVKDTEWRRLAGMDKLKEALLEEHQTCLEIVRGIGYRVVPPAEQTGFAEKTMMGELKKVYRQAGSRLTNVRSEALSSDQRRDNVEAIARLSMLMGLQERAEKRELPMPSQAADEG